MIGIGGAFRLRPSHTTVRTGPYTAVREIALTRFDQRWKTEQFEVGVGKPNREGFAPCDVPGATAASGRIAQFPRDSQCDQRCTTATWCFPLTPQSGPQSQSDPTSESDQHLGRFAKAEIAAPTPHIRDQFFHCRLDADAFGPSRDLPGSPFKPLQRFRRNRALGIWTSREAEPEELPFLRSCHRTLGLVYLELELLFDEARNALHHPLTRCERRCYSRPHNEQSGIRGTPARGRVHRARGYSAVAKAVLLAEFLPRWG